MGSISTKMEKLIANSSAVRAMFEEGNRLRKIYGADNVFDFSLGNPSVPAPEALNEAIRDVALHEDPLVLHGYMSNSGYEDVREAVAQNINKRFGTHFGFKNICMTVGAASALVVALKTLINPGDEVAIFAPYFMEYNNYIANFDGVVKIVPPNPPTFMPDMDAFRKTLSFQTKVVLINTPNNPSGAVYDEETIKAIAAVLEEKQKEYGHPIYILSDEPYRELAYDGIEVPYIPLYYRNTLVGYSFSKALSVPGERIGYLAIPDEADDSETIQAAAAIATRVLGYVNAPSLMQKAIVRVLDEKTDIAAYDRNRKDLYNGLTKAGFECLFPAGAFYLFMKTPEDDLMFTAAAKKYNILVVPGTSFSCPGYVRIAYCVSHDTIINSMPAFEKLAHEYGLN